MKKKKKAEAPPPSGEENRPKKLVEEERKWAKRLTRSKAFQNRYSGAWEEYRRLIFNEGPDSATGGKPWEGESANRVAYGWGLFEGLQTATYVQNPEILVSARDGSKKPVATRVSQVVKYDFEQMDVKTIGNLCQLDEFTCGYGAVIEDVETYHRYGEDGEKTGEVDDQEFGLRRLEPRDVLFDPSARNQDLSDSRYLFVAWYPTIEQLRSDEYITDLPDDIEEFPESSEYTRTTGSTPSETTVARQGVAGNVSGTGGGEKDPAFKTVCVWECYDKVNKEVLYLTDHHGLIIGRCPWPANLRFGPKDLFPVTLLYAHPVPGRFYPKAEAELIAPQLRKLNITERLIDEDSRTKFRKVVTLAGILTDDQKSKVTDESVANALISVDFEQVTNILGIPPGQTQLANLDMSKLVTMLEDVAPKKDLFVRYEMLEKQIQHIVGYGPAQRGGMPSTRSAREAMMINAKQDQRLDKRKDRINDFNRLVAMKHVRYLQEYMATERYAKVLPKSAQLAEWVKYGRDDIAGDFEFEVVAGSTTPRNTEVKKAATLQMAQAIMPVLQQSQQSIRPVIQLLAEVNGWPDYEVDQCFGDVKAKAIAVAQKLGTFSQGQTPPQELLDAVAQLLMAELSPAEFEMIAKSMKEGKPMMGAGGGMPGPEMMGQRGDPAPQATQQGVP